MRSKAQQFKAAGVLPAAFSLFAPQALQLAIPSNVEPGFDRLADPARNSGERWNPGNQRFRGAWAAALAFAATPVLAQPVVPPGAVEQFQHVVGTRVEAVTILGGDYGAAGGFYTFRGGDAARLKISKMGGGGDVAARRPLGMGGLQWAPVLQGNLGFISAENEFATGYLQGNKSVYDVFAMQAGGGARLYFTDQFSAAVALSGIYGQTENEFRAQNSVGEAIKVAASGTYVDWTLETWSAVPSLDLRYTGQWRTTLVEFSSRFTFFHTESFASTSPVLAVNGDSHTWENKIDVDVPLDWRLFGHGLRTGGFISRTDVGGSAAAGLNEDNFYTVNGRLVVDLLGRVWKVRWLGVGASWFSGKHFDGWTAGADIRIKF